MQKKSDINRTKIKDGCQSGRKVVTHNSSSDLPLGARTLFIKINDLGYFIVFFLKKNSIVLPTVWRGGKEEPKRKWK